ncbi:GDSL-type esterase/lipase family protein [Nocardiopsis sp. CC223A]|uniref:GDSL-type esterase/lipase family protein n=1 Tax=Nocardiopsis sp. CC223A TaxID=3044051 RepID=UPI00278C8B56|nr:GDSL-type esterase/lipase family protein [Nocardiopsis sp. CC223A]
MLAAMAVTLLFIQVGSPGLTGEDGPAADGPLPVPGPPPGELKVMVVGDSLTQGSSGDHTWRYHLWRHLTGSEVAVDFVGPYDDLYDLAGEEFGDDSYAAPDFDRDHAARWGHSAGELSDEVSLLAAEYEPHYLLLLSGLEDILAGGSADRALEGVGETISTVRVVRGETRFVVGELPPVEGTADDARANSEIARFNMGVVALAEQLTSADSPVVIARVADGYSPARDNWDQAHPNARGELRIAAAFADALADPLGVGPAHPRPLPETEVGPLTAPAPEPEEGEDGLVLSWAAVPGATDYRVIQRRVGPDPDGETVLPLEIEEDGGKRSALVEGLFSGARYEFTVIPFKGRDSGEASEPIQLVWREDPPPGPDRIRLQDGGSTLVWEQVEDTTHYEVWVRPLDCTFADDRRPPADTTDGARSPDDGSEEPAPDGGDPSPRPPGPQPTPTPRPEPEPEPPVSPPPGEPRCERRDDRGPDGGEGWRTLGSTGTESRWTVTVSGDYEIVVRSHRDYVEGGFSDSILTARP